DSGVGAWRSGAAPGHGRSAPTRRMGASCCGFAASGPAAAAPPSSVMNSRRLIASPEAQDKASNRLRLAHRKEPADVRFTPESGHVRYNLRCPLWANSGHRDFIIRLLRRRVAEAAKALRGLLLWQS